MEWVPYVVQTDEKVISSLTDLEIQKVKKLEDKWRISSFKQGKKLIELEILRIYKSALVRKEEGLPDSLWNWLNEGEKEELTQLTKKVDAAKTFKEKLRYEVAGHRIYLESISRQTQFRFKEEVEKYIDILERCETRKEVELTTSILRDLFAEAWN